MDDRLSLTLHPSLAEVERLGKEFGRLAERRGLRPEVRFAINLALEEIVTNVIQHGRQAGDERPIRVEVVVGLEEVTARVEDSARPFDPLRVAPPDTAAPLERRQVGGLGIYLAKQFLDGLEYTYVGGKNRLDMRKRL